MPRSEVNLILYAVELRELLDWVGCADDARYQEAWQALQGDEDDESGWEPRAMPVLEGLLKRLVYEGKVYDGLDEDERYLMTQILIDLFDEFVDQDALSEELPLDRLHALLEALPKGNEGRTLGALLTRGRELGGTRHLWEAGSPEDTGPYLGYLTPEEAGRLAEALGEAMKQQRSRPSGLVKQLQAAAVECSRSGLELLSFIG